MADDIKSLLNKFGASPDRYLEVDHFPEYVEPRVVVAPLARDADKSDEPSPMSSAGTQRMWPKPEKQQLASAVQPPSPPTPSPVKGESQTPRLSPSPSGRRVGIRGQPESEKQQHVPAMRSRPHHPGPVNRAQRHTDHREIHHTGRSVTTRTDGSQASSSHPSPPARGGRGNQQQAFATHCEDAKGVHAVTAPVAAAPSLGITSLRALLNEVEQERKNAARVGHEQAPGPDMQKATPAKVVAVMSIKGGVGKSTLSAALAGALNPGGRSIAIDLDPQNVLQYHLGVNPDQVETTQAGLDVDDWNAGLIDGMAGVRVLPYGAPSREDRRALERALDQDGHWLQGKLSRMHLDANDVVILDTPPGRTPYLEQALSVADLVIAVIMPDAASFMLLDQTDHLFERLSQQRDEVDCCYLVNQFDAARSFSQDMLEVLRRRLGERLIGAIALDDAISKGLAFGTCPLLDAAGDSAARQDVLAIAEVVRARLMTLPVAGCAS